MSANAAAASPRVSILIVVATADAALARCRESIARSAPGVAFELVVALNGLAARDASRLRGELTGARVLDAEGVNLGFAGAINAARALARGDYLVSLHDDAEVEPGWLDALVETAERDGGAGAVGSLQLERDGGVRAIGYRLLRDGRTVPPWDGDPPAAESFSAPLAIDYAGACSLLVRAATWDRVGGADERLYPLYYVDVDLCLAIRARGERVLLEPRSRVVHEGGGSTERDFAHFLVARNRELMLEKWGDLIRLAPGPGATYTLGDDELPTQLRDGPRERQLRQAAVRDAYAAELRARLARQTSELEHGRDELVAALEQAHAGWHGLQEEYERTRAALLEAQAALLAARAGRAEDALELARLGERERALALIERREHGLPRWRRRLRRAALGRDLAAPEPGA